mmetsp:Transcript_2575/g.9835  ORF Transcript_2575/g.9835 Transcript_2575/m.9835 type:complete len:429 (+) Transcript_2575:1610-2896(+)
MTGECQAPDWHYLECVFDRVSFCVKFSQNRFTTTQVFLIPIMESPTISLPSHASIACTKELNAELSEMKHALSHLKQQYQDQSNQVLAKQYELQRRMEKKSQKQDENHNVQVNMMQKLEHVMKWAKKLEDECTQTKRERRMEERRSKLQMKLKRRNFLGDENMPLRAARFNSNALTRIDSKNLMMNVPNVGGRHLSNITNVIPSHNLKYVDSLHADLQELNTALKPLSQNASKSKPTLIRRLSEADMPLVMQKAAPTQQRHSYNAAAPRMPQPPSAPPPSQCHFQRKFYAQDDMPARRRSVNALPSHHSDELHKRTPPRRPRSEICFTSDLKSRLRARSNQRYSHNNDLSDEDYPRRSVQERRSRKQCAPAARGAHSKNKKQPVKKDKVKRLYGASTPVKSPPKKNFRRLLSKSKKKEIDRKLRHLMR